MSTLSQDDTRPSSPAHVAGQARTSRRRRGFAQAVLSALSAWHPQDALVLGSAVDRAAFGAVAEDITAAVSPDVLCALDARRPIIVPGESRFGGVLLLMRGGAGSPEGRRESLTAVLISLGESDHVDLDVCDLTAGLRLLRRRGVDLTELPQLLLSLAPEWRTPAGRIVETASADAAADAA
ncbi:hypothetical protein [Microbacterium azadirachtae]|uniref:hypothetical protein n=1 Tax=Microbacterium azadirachtae TaxID=582680 RepID=UPI003F74CBA4